MCYLTLTNALSKWLPNVVVLPNKQEMPGSVLEEDTNPSGSVSGRAADAVSNFHFRSVGLLPRTKKRKPLWKLIKLLKLCEELSNHY